MKRILLVFAFVLMGINAFCNEKKNHVIISFDLKSDIMMNKRRDYTIKQVKEVLPQILKTNGINSGYVSLQTFSASENAENLDDYIIELKAPFTEFSNISIVLDNLQSSDFSGIMPEYGYSLLTVARPYSLLKFKEQKNEILIDRTFLVLITDNHFNGNDNYKKELDDASPNGIRKNEAVKKSIMANMNSIQQNYFYELIDEKTINRVNNIYYAVKASISLYEVIPLQQYFSVESVLDFPHTITATRTKDGYKATFKINQLENPNYRFISSEAFLPVDGYNEKRHVKLNQNEIFDIPESLVEQVGEDNISIDFRTWVQLIDNVYNHTILSPDGDKLQGAEGLNRSIKIKLEEDAKILGFIPLTDGLYDISFWTNDQSVAAATWGVIFILILLAVMIFSIWQSTRYKSKRNDVKL
jgi:hypothetical protein